MDLLIDSGNSRVKWATCDGSDLSTGAAIDRASSNYDEQIRSMLLTLNESDDGGIFVSDVSKRPEDNIVDKIRSLATATDIRADVYSVGATDEGFGIKNCYREPDTLGSDRWTALIGARHFNSGDLVVLDCGTAITVDGLRADGDFIGGMILPSAWLGEQALSDGTSLIDRESWSTDAAQNSLGRSTGSCVQRGAALAALGGVRLAVDAVKNELSEQCSILVTGGDALIYIEVLPDCARHDEDLVLRGLSVIAAESRRTDTE